MMYVPPLIYLIVLLQCVTLLALVRVLRELKDRNRIPMGKLNQAIDRVEKL